MKKPDLTDIWNEATKLPIWDCNEVWGALKTIEKHGLCSLGLDPD